MTLLLRGVYPKKFCGREIVWLSILYNVVGSKEQLKTATMAADFAVLSYERLKEFASGELVKLWSSTPENFPF